MKRKMKKQFFIPACVLSAAAVGFVIIAMGHPELSFLRDGWMPGILYGVYADAVVLLFILSFCKSMWTIAGYPIRPISMLLMALIKFTTKWTKAV